jgi:hypothetical protein
VSTSLTVIAICLLGTSCKLIADASLGWGPGDLLPGDSETRIAVDWLFSRFALFPGDLCIHDVDVPTNQVEILKLYDSITSSRYGAPLDPVNFLTMMYNALFLGAQAVAPTGTSPIDIAKMLNFDMSWTHPTLAPFGTLSNNSMVFYSIFNNFRKIPANPFEAWDPAKIGFMFADLSGVNTFNYDNVSGMEQIRFAKMPFYNARMETEDIFIDAIKDMKRQVGNSPLRDNAIIHSPILVFWEVFEELQPKLILLIVVDAALIFLITLLFFSLDVITALITCLACTMIVLEIYGLSVSLMSFNIFIAALTLMSMGLSVEFTAHLAAAFSLGHGSASDRLGCAMADTFPALLEGSVTTLLGILPLAFHPITFFVKYIFGIIAIAVSVGLLNGVVFMPAMLALLSPLLPYVPCRRHDRGVLEVDVSCNTKPTLLASSGEVIGNKNMASVVPSDP